MNTIAKLIDSIPILDSARQQAAIVSVVLRRLLFILPECEGLSE